jgi:hypothetical protein
MAVLAPLTMTASRPAGVAALLPAASLIPIPPSAVPCWLRDTVLLTIPTVPTGTQIEWLWRTSLRQARLPPSGAAALSAVIITAGRAQRV